MPRASLLFFALGLGAALAAAQSPKISRLDLTAAASHPRLERGLHRPLPEHYIWTHGKAAKGAEHDFVRKFQVKNPPRQATVYVAGPGQLSVWLNGQSLSSKKPKSSQPKSGHLRPQVFHAAARLKAGLNWLAIAAHGGEKKLAVKIVPAGFERNAPAVIISDARWKGRINAPKGWESSAPKAAGWQPVRDLGGIESHIDNFQWNADSGLYLWPGYDGISPFLARMPVAARRLLQVTPGAGRFRNLQALYQRNQLSVKNGAEFAVRVPAATAGAARPSLILDFGREIDGRIALIPADSKPLRVVASYGESLGEVNHPYLGATPIYLRTQKTSYGPKSAFRYVRLQFEPNKTSGWETFRAVRLDAIYYPVRYRGSFQSSDALLNRIWATGAYTAHLCMLDDIWDAPKRDRGRWMGDLDVSGRVIDSVFADHFLMQDTMNRLIGDAEKPAQHDVNGIPGYSAFWIMGERDYYLHTGNRAYLKTLHRPLLKLMAYMRTEMKGARFINAHHAWPFVDWSPGLFKDNAATRRATQMEFYRAFVNGAWMLGQMGDQASARKWADFARRVRTATQAQMRSSATFGRRWQPNAMAVFSGVATPAERRAIWTKVLGRPKTAMITPYYNFYVIDAMAKLGQRKRALGWIRKYWGGMIREGATSFWEAYDPSWPKKHFHKSLQADNGKGYFVSLSHGWSSGPTAWLTEQVLGLKPLAPGFRELRIRPDLAGLRWARGAEPTPHGQVKVSFHALGKDRLRARITLPAGITARVLMPTRAGEKSLRINGKMERGRRVERGRRLELRLTHAGVYKIG